MSERSVCRVAIIRDQGSNGDREMAAAFYRAGFQTWDIHMYDGNKDGDGDGDGGGDGNHSVVATGVICWTRK